MYASDGVVEAVSGFLDLVSARLWSGTFERLLLISEAGVQLLEPETSRTTHTWALADVVSAHQEDGSPVVTLKLSSGYWAWQRSPSFTLPSPEQAVLLYRNLARRCADRWNVPGSPSGSKRAPRRHAPKHRDDEDDEVDPSTPNAMAAVSPELLAERESQRSAAEAAAARAAEAEAARAAALEAAEAERSRREQAETVTLRERSSSVAQQAEAAARLQAVVAAASEAAAALETARQEATTADRMTSGPAASISKKVPQLRF